MSPSRGSSMGVGKMTLVFFLVAIALAAFLQAKSGAWRSEFGGHADEASHFLSGLMLRDYVCTGLGESPALFAKNYYDHYPKIAIGHYPPVFYLIEGAWLILFPPSKAAVWGLMVLLAGLFSTLTFRASRLFLGDGYAVWCGLMTLLLSLTQRYTSILMSDTLLSIGCLWGVMAFASYLEKPTIRRALWFGGIAAGAILVKGSALLLALVPGPFLFLRREWRLLRSPSLWVSAVPVLLLAAPWVVATYSITQRGMDHQPLREYIRLSIPYYSKAFIAQWGWTAAGLAAIGMVISAIQWIKGRLGLWQAVPIVLLVAASVFYAIVPSGLDERYLLPLAPAVFALSALALREIGAWLGRKTAGGRSMQVSAFLIVFSTALVEWETFRIPEKQFEGYGSVVKQLASESASGDEVLVSSDEAGEGAFIAELALSEPHRPGMRVQRASKLLGESDWLGRDYRLRFESVQAFGDFVERSKIRWIVVDRSINPNRVRQHHAMVAEYLAHGKGPFEKVGSFPMKRRDFSGNEGVILYGRRGTLAEKFGE